MGLAWLTNCHRSLKIIWVKICVCHTYIHESWQISGVQAPLLCSTSVCVWIMQSFVTEVGAEKFVHCLEVCSLNILTLLSGTSQNSTHKPLTGVAPPPTTFFVWLVSRSVGWVLFVVWQDFDMWRREAWSSQWPLASASQVPGLQARALISLGIRGYSKHKLWEAAAWGTQ